MPNFGRVIRQRNFAQLHSALDAWTRTLPGLEPRHRSQIKAALTNIGAAPYGRTPSGDAADAWHELGVAVSEGRRRSREIGGPSVLPPMNPDRAADETRGAFVGLKSL